MTSELDFDNSKPFLNSSEVVLCLHKALLYFVKTASSARARLETHTHHLKSSSSTMASKAFAIVAGVGPGTGAACARRFASAYPVVLMARNPDNYESLVQEINKSGGKAMGISADVSSEESMKAAFDKIKQEHKDASCAAAIFNASGRFVRTSLLEMKVDDFQAGWEVSVYVECNRFARLRGLTDELKQQRSPNLLPKLASPPP